MAETMVEKVARAICDKEEPDGLGNWENYKEHASAAIEAWREPTLPMLHAGHDAANRSYDLARKVYRAMIDAALKEE